MTPEQALALHLRTHASRITEADISATDLNRLAAMVISFLNSRNGLIKPEADIFVVQPDVSDARLSKLLWDAREVADMYATILIGVSVPPKKNFAAETRDEIDCYRAERGWSPNGFGGER